MRPVASAIKCLACGYDLVGLPSVTCPECGSNTAELQRLDALRRLAGRRVSRHWLLAAVVFVVIIGSLDSGRLSRFRVNWLMIGDHAVRFDWLTFAFAAIPFFAWLELGRRAKSPINAYIHFFGMPVTLVTWNWLVWASEFRREMSFPWIPAIAYVLLLTWLMSTVPTIWTLAMSFTVTAVLWVGSVFVVSVARLWLGLEWSIVSDSRIGQIYQQYPLRNDEVVSMLMVPTLGSVLALLVMLGIRRSSRTRGMSRPISTEHIPSPPP